LFPESKSNERALSEKSEREKFDRVGRVHADSTRLSDRGSGRKRESINNRRDSNRSSEASEQKERQNSEVRRTVTLDAVSQVDFAIFSVEVS
jgi:hypothetical protein